MILGSNIRKRRIELNLSQQDVANALGYKTRSSIAKIEKGKSHISPEKLLTLANVLNTSVDYLLTGKTNNHEVSKKNNLISDYSYFDPQNKRNCIAVILAGGKYRVNKHKIPYQFVTVKEKPVIIYTLEAYQRHPLIDEIYVVCAEGWEDFLPAYIEKYNINKLQKLIPAGEKGIISVKNAVEWLSLYNKASDIIVFQEATRPFIDSETISNIIHCCIKKGSAVSYTHLEDTTPFLINEKENSITQLDAYNLISLQSPEAYPLGALKVAFNKASKINHNFEESSCAVFMYHIGNYISLCEGNHNNMRIIHEEDLKLFNALL